MAENTSRCPMPTQTPQQRIHNFDEVARGYDAQMAVGEAKRCLQCKNAQCMKACPVGIDIPGFIGKIAQEDFSGAYEVLSRSTSLPAICGRVCPQENQCEGKCIRGLKSEPIAIGRLERFAADTHNAADAAPKTAVCKNGRKVAVIGAGPSGLTAAGELAQYGYSVTVFEALHTPGGVLVYGIPEFRLPKTIVKTEIDHLTEMGVEIRTNTVIGKTLTIDELFDDGYEAVFIGTGAGLPSFMKIPGENLKGVYSANEYLTRINLMKAYLPNSKTPVMKSKAVAVVGGGNVAMDAARCAKRLGAEKVYIVYRRSLEELPARHEEVEHAMEEEIDFRLLTNPKEILDDENGFVRAIVCAEMELGEPDEKGRRKPIEKPGSRLELAVDTVIMAIGTTPNPLISRTTPGLATNERGCIVTRDERGRTTKTGVYAGGDAVTGSATVILAMGAGKQAAAAIHEYLQNK